MQCLRRVHRIIRYGRSHSIVASSCHQNPEPANHKFLLSKPVLDEKFLLDEKNIERINENTKLRKGVGDIHLVHDLKKKMLNQELSTDAKQIFKQQLHDELKKIPNDTHPDVRGYGDEPKVVAYYNDKPEFIHQPLEFSDICKKLNVLRTDHLGNFAGHKAYFLMSDLAELVSKNSNS